MDLKSPLISQFEQEPIDYSRHVSSRRFCSKRNLIAIGCIVALLVATTAERIVFKIMVDRMESYRYFIAQFITFIYIPPTFLIVGYRATATDQFDEEMTDFPKSKFFFMAALDLCHTMLLMIAGGQTPAPLTVLFFQATIPATVLLSSIVFKTKYSKYQLIGSGLIFAGCIIALAPVFLIGLMSEQFALKQTAWNSLIYLLAAIPGSASMLYKEHAIRQRPMDICYLNAWVSTYQFVLGLLLAPLVFDFDVFHLDQQMGGMECLFNGASESEWDNCHVRNNLNQAQTSFHHEQYGFLIILGYVALGVAVNAFLIQVLTRASASLMYTTVALAVPIAFIVLEVYQYEQPHSDWITDLIGLISLLFGLALYRSEMEPNTHALTISAEEMEAASLLDDQEQSASYNT